MSRDDGGHANFALRNARGPNSCLSSWQSRSIRQPNLMRSNSRSNVRSSAKVAKPAAGEIEFCPNRWQAHHVKGEREPKFARSLEGDTVDEAAHPS